MAPTADDVHICTISRAIYPLKLQTRLVPPRIALDSAISPTQIIQVMA
jgi:hypothetical protein